MNYGLLLVGHDNGFNNSFPMIFLKRLKPTFDILGIDLIVRNIAQGEMTDVLHIKVTQYYYFYRTRTQQFELNLSNFRF